MGELAKACRKSVRADQRSRAVARSFRAGGGENADMRRLLTEEKIREIVALIPDDWLHWSESPGMPQEIRDLYPVLM